MKRKYNKNTFFLIVLTFFEAIFIKVLQFRILPEKYFYDSNKILRMINTGYRYNDKAYDFTADVFSKINVFGFNTLKQWAFFIGIVFSIIILFQLIKKDKYTIKEYFFIYANIGLLNIFVFNLSKDIIQFIFFLFAYLILKKNKWSNLKKLFFISIIFATESIYFRAYYALLIVLLWLSYFVYKLLTKSDNKKKNKFTKLVFFTIILFIAFLFILQKTSPENYSMVANTREIVNLYREDSLDATTIINNPLGSNTTLAIFTGNYILNAIRISIPLELVTKGLKYIIFAIYQLFITISLIKSYKNNNNKNILWILLFINYFMLSVIFEPDFGSFIRHEAALTLILIEVVSIANIKKMED